MTAWTVLAVAFGLLNLVLVAIVADEQGAGYCESVDHPGPCPNLVPWFLCGLTATAGGSWCLGACVGFRRRRPDARRRLVMALLTWAGALLALGVWAAVVDDSSRLSGPGGALVVLAAVNAGMCALVAGLMTWFPGGNGCAIEA